MMMMMMMLQNTPARTRAAWQVEDFSVTCLTGRTVVLYTAHRLHTGGFSCHSQSLAWTCQTTITALQ